MRKLNYLMTAIVLILFAACEKAELVEQKQETVKNDTPVSVEHGMLVFNNQETFDETVKMLEGMTSEERKTWEGNLGFKSYDRLINEIIDAEIKFHEKYENLTEEEQLAIMKSDIYERHSELAKKYLAKGVAKMVVDKNGEEHMDFTHLIHSKIINEEGFYKVGKRIMQYTEDKFKAIESGDFSKMPELKSRTKATSGVGNDIFVSNIKTARIDPGDGDIIDPGDGGGGYPDPPMTYYTFPWHNVAYVSKTFDKQKIVLIEFFQQYSYSSTTFKTHYAITVKAEKKDFWGNWVYDQTRMWFDGYAKILDGETDPLVTRDINDRSGALIQETIYYAFWPKGTYPYHYLPWVPESDWKATRWGGPSGIWIRVVNHVNATTNL